MNYESQMVNPAPIVDSLTDLDGTALIIKPMV